MKDKYKVLIIGAGKIAGGFDKPTDSCILSHAHAVVKNKKVSLLGFYDTDFRQAGLTTKKWGGQAFKSLTEAFCQKPDIVYICTPDGTHYRMIKKVAHYRPRLVVCEKPLTTDLKKSKALWRLCRKNKILVLVNYSRKFDHSIWRLKSEIEKNKYGKIIGAYGAYGKGLMHNGSHLINLALFLFGPLKTVKIIHRIADYKNEKSIGGCLSFKQCPQFLLAAIDSRKYWVFELKIYFEKCCVTLLDSGYQINYQPVVKDRRYKDYLLLGQGRINNTTLDQSASFLLHNAIAVLKKKATPLCGIREAIETQAACLKLL